MIGFPRSQAASGKNIHLNPTVSYGYNYNAIRVTPSETPNELTPQSSPRPTASAERTRNIQQTRHTPSLSTLQAREAHRRRVLAENYNSSLNHDHNYFGNAVLHYVPVPLAREDRDQEENEITLPRVA